MNETVTTYRMLLHGEALEVTNKLMASAGEIIENIVMMTDKSKDDAYLEIFKQCRLVVEAYVLEVAANSR